MTLIIDGHNLIPKVPGLSLSDENDELHLLELVREYCRLSRSRAEVFFDGAPPPRQSPSGGGLVHTHYIRKGTPADDAIIAFLKQSGKAARNHTVVTSDRRVQSEARALGSPVLTSEVFAGEMIRRFRESTPPEGRGEPSLSEDEVNHWLEIFGSDRDTKS